MGARCNPVAWTVAVLAVVTAVAGAAPPMAPAGDAARVAAVEALGRLPLLFVPEQVKPGGVPVYAVRGNDASLWLTGRGLTYRLHPAGEAGEGSGSWVVALDFVDAAPRAPEGAEPLGTKVSFFKGPKAAWRTGLEAYSSVVYREPWPGVDVEVSGAAGELETTFVVRPGADPGAIRLAYRGASAVRVNPDGGLTVETPLGPIDELAPVAYQVVDGRKVTVAAAFELEEVREPGVQGYRFRLGPYDRERKLVVDPVTLVYCGYIGGGAFDGVFDAVVDAAGNLYVAGATDSSETTFPVAVGPDPSYNGGVWDGFVAKVRPDGSGLEYCGYIGGSASDEAGDIAVDSSGNAYVAGTTQSTEATFPVTVGPDLTHNGGVDAFVAKVDADGTGLEYCGYLGGSADDWGIGGIAVDGSGRAYVAGDTYSSEATFPVLVGPDLTYAGGEDVFVARVNAAGTALEYCGYIGGSAWEEAHGMAVDSAGRAYVAGETTSSEATFPATFGPDLTHNGGYDAFVARVNEVGSAFEYCGYVGGSGTDSGADVAVDLAGHAYLVGETTSTEATFPVLVGPDLTHNGSRDAFVARVSTTGDSLQRCGYVGGAGQDYGCDIALDATGNAYIAGATNSDETTFPVLGGPDLSYNGGTSDAFVARVNAAGDGLDYCGYIGGSGVEAGGSPYTPDIAVDAMASVYVTSGTSSTEVDFPVVGGPDLTHNGGDWDGFVAKVTPFDLIFGNNFVSGDTTAWSHTEP